MSIFFGFIKSKFVYTFYYSTIATLFEFNFDIRHLCSAIFLLNSVTFFTGITQSIFCPIVNRKIP